MKTEKKFIWKEGDIQHELNVRNVGNKNEAQIQFVLDRYNIYKERSLPLVCFNIYKKDVKEFIEAIITEI